MDFPHIERTYVYKNITDEVLLSSAQQAIHFLLTSRLRKKQQGEAVAPSSPIALGNLKASVYFPGCHLGNMVT